MTAIHAAPSAETLGYPYRWSAPERTEAEVTLTGSLPPWLRGRLVRTAPAVFRLNRFQVEHWFDGLGMFYSFELGDAPRFRQRLLESEAKADAERGTFSVATFGTDTRRSLLSRIVRPIPKITDNTNVNVIPWRDGAWLAMTESPSQYLIDAETLEPRGLERYDDRLPRLLSMTAHPAYDSARGALVNVGANLGPKSELVVYRQDRGSRTRVVEGRLPFKRVPYVHSFGFSERTVVLMDHPFRVSPVGMLFSNRAFVNHFKWEPEKGARLWKLDRATQRFTAYECDTFFCFHVINQFEDGDDVVLDFLGYDDPSVISRLSLDSLVGSVPPVTARPMRARLSPGKKRAELEQLSPLAFEFPAIDYARCNGRAYGAVWGGALASLEDTRSAIVRLDLASGRVTSHADPDVTFGEPIFVGDPASSRDEEGVILAVGTRESADRSMLRVLDATSLEPLATLEIDVALPLGFHGSFALAR
jgi:beta,beta-carotene 9',10'-dioxygenase